MEDPGKRARVKKIETCADYLVDRFTFKEVLGRGSFGFVIGVQDKLNAEVEMVLKIQEFSIWSKTEALMYSALTTLVNRTPVFLTLYGVFICQEIPREWMDAVLRALPELRNVMDRLERPFVLMLQRKIPYKFSKVPEEYLSFNHMRSYLFILIHGLVEARLAYPGFKLRDISYDNIMFLERDPTVPFKLKLPGDMKERYYEISNVRFVPVFIDYGRATLNQKFDAIEKPGEEFQWMKSRFTDAQGNVQEETFPPSNDLWRLLYFLPKATKKFAEMPTDMVDLIGFWKPYLQRLLDETETYYTPGHEMLQSLLRLDYFTEGATANIRVRYVPMINLVDCHICLSRPATRQYKHTKDCYVFCNNKRCEAQLACIKDILP